MNSRKLVLISALMFALCCGLTRPVRAELRAGIAKIDMTPDVQAMRVPLGGYAARRGAAANGVHDPVFARALVLSEGNAKIGIVSVDLCFVPANLKAEVEKRIAEEGVTGLTGAHLMLCATHTHCGPDPLALHSGNIFPDLQGWTQFDPSLLNYTADRIAAAIVDASRRSVPARAGSKKVGLGRRHLNRNRRGELTVDPELTLLKVTALNGRTLAAIFNFAAHPTLYDASMREISADWPGAATRRVEEGLGNGAICLFLNGSEGDASPNAFGATADERIANYGEIMSRIVLQHLQRMKMQSRLALNVWHQEIVLPVRQPHPSFLLAARQMGADAIQARQLVSRLMPSQTSLCFTQIGSLLFIGFPCEPSGEIGLTVKNMARQAGFKTPAVAALTNDWLAYCLTPAQYRAGKYEASMSFYGENFGLTMIQAAEAGLNRTRTPNRQN